MKPISVAIFSISALSFSFTTLAAPINFNSDSRLSQINQSGDVVISADGLSFSIYDTGSEYLHINFMTPANSTGISFDYTYTPASYTTDAYYLAELSSSGSSIDSDIHYWLDGNVSGTQTLMFQPGNTWHDVIWSTERGYGAAPVPDNLILTVSNVNFVPLPAAAYLFASGILGLISIARKRK